MWLFGAIGSTEDCDQPISRYTLDNRYISTAAADIRNTTSYNELFAQFHDLDLSHHTLVVENINEGATLFLDYYLVEPVPPDALITPTGNLKTGGIPLRTSISEQPMLMKTKGLSGGIAVLSLVGAVVGGILLAFFVAVLVFFAWRKKGGSLPYYYHTTEAHELLIDGMHHIPDPTVVLHDRLYRVKA